jgi:putative hydrolase of the HAD superfamily
MSVLNSSGPVLILDLGNVIFPLEFEDFDGWLASCQSECSGEEFYQRYHPIYVDYESGTMDTMAFLEQLRVDLKLNFSDENFQAMWLSCWKRDMEGMEDLLLKYKSILPIHVLSNTNDMHMSDFFVTKGILKHFQRYFLSHELQCAKPNHLIYEKVRHLLDVPASSLLFFDDKIENVEGARACGWNAEVFVDAEHTEQRLLEHMEMVGHG